MRLHTLHTTLQLSYRAIGVELGAAASRPAPTPARVSDWISGARPTPDWAEAAAAKVICARWALARSQASAPDLAAVDLRWSAILDPVLGRLYAALHAPDAEGMRVALQRTLESTAADVSKRLCVTIPGASPCE